MGCHSLLQGIFSTQGSNPGLLDCRQILYHLSQQGNPFTSLDLSNNSMCPLNFDILNYMFLGARGIDLSELVVSGAIHPEYLVKQSLGISFNILRYNGLPLNARFPRLFTTNYFKRAQTTLLTLSWCRCSASRFPENLQWPYRLQIFHNSVVIILSQAYFGNSLNKKSVMTCCNFDSRSLLKVFITLVISHYFKSSHQIH